MPHYNSVLLKTYLTNITPFQTLELILPFFKPIIIGQITIQVDATQEPYGIDRVEFYIVAKTPEKPTHINQSGMSAIFSPHFQIL
jgi:hypothetical protein